MPTNVFFNSTTKKKTLTCLWKWLQYICLWDPKQRLARNSYDRAAKTCFSLCLHPKRWPYIQPHRIPRNLNLMTMISPKHHLNVHANSCMRSTFPYFGHLHRLWQYKIHLITIRESLNIRINEGGTKYIEIRITENI